MEEIWKSIKDYEELYEISNFGRVKSLHKGNKIMKQFKNKKGHYITQLYCIMDVVRSFNLQTGSNICSCCKGKIKSAYGYIWKYRID